MTTFFRYNLVFTFADGFVSDETILARSYAEAVRELCEIHDENIVCVGIESKLSADGEPIEEL